MIFVLDNYDSFTYNLVQRLGEIDPRLDIRVERNDQITVEQIEALQPDRIIVSPGPCTPREAGISTEVIARLGPKIPMLGVCLGHQSISDAFGGQVVLAERLMHGKTSLVWHDGSGLFRGLENPFEATRYHSLIVPDEGLPPELIPCAWTREPGQPEELMGVRHRDYPIHGVQFHPESFLCPAGIQLLRNFLELPVQTLSS
ncbi:Aminodeoxychorismate/anthranilate synthase component 2 [Maioricimonas rarisocia]|uniref:Aminodeoxychorismate/anthranilate synthase component 2 n=1 Tax=Maioricimonas rarisocia TaxID=2528026 RepID=A0A517ZA04_9PLAN|nr:aminodeoxychorismate/anthranilate synthase component II [Maioricimonas rarisocia]QDU39325.1 Aminodeoxychorismate/anthranilate synthase component 2 [Maioricimonas rarisocia]